MFSKLAQCESRSIYWKGKTRKKWHIQNIRDIMMRLIVKRKLSVGKDFVVKSIPRPNLWFFCLNIQIQTLNCQRGKFEKLHKIAFVNFFDI